MKSALKNLSITNPNKIFKTHVETCISHLKNFTNHGLITEARVFHGHMYKTGLSSQKRIAVNLLILYLNSRKCDEANEIVKEFNGFNLIVWNCLISANVKWGNLDEAQRLFAEMPERNEVSWTALISGFMKHGKIEDSMWYFENNPFENVVSWTAGISGFVQNGLNLEALKLFSRLLRSGVFPNDVTFTSVVKACACLSDFRLGMSILGLIVKVGFEHNLSVSNSLITMNLRLGEIDYAKSVFDGMQTRDVVSWTAILDVYFQMDDLSEARKIFDSMPERNEVSWSAMIARYGQCGFGVEAYNLFVQMVEKGFKPNISCFASVISSLASIAEFQLGTIIHGHVLKIGLDGNIFVSTSLIDLYCKCGKPEDGHLLFDLADEKNVALWNSMVGGYSLNGNFEKAMELFLKMPHRNYVTWNSIISGYVENGQCDQVFEIFHEMILSGETPNNSTFASILCACASIASLEKGENFHCKIMKYGIQFDVFLGTALSDMYAKCGDIRTAMRVFRKMPEKNEVSWTAMIQGLADNGFAKESLFLFEEMKKTSYIAPNEIMFLAVLFACSHCGLVDNGLYYFKLMDSVYGLKPKSRHYTCVVDLLSRSGRLSEAEEFITKMPFKPETSAWLSLLSGCKSHKNEEIAERTARKLLQIVEDDSAGYVLLSNIYAAAGRWIDVSDIRKLMREKGLKKSGGCSWVEVRNQIHSFHSEDGNHSHTTEIYGTLDLLRYEMLALQ